MNMTTVASTTMPFLPMGLESLCLYQMFIQEVSILPNAHP